MTVWALVPARGGSKSIPLKNLAPLAGLELLTGFAIFHIADPLTTMEFSNAVATKIVR